MGFINLADRLKFEVTGEDNAINSLFKCVGPCVELCVLCVFTSYIAANLIPKSCIAGFKMCWW